MSGKGAVSTGKGFTLFFLKEDVNYIIKVIQPLEKLRLLVDGAIEEVNHEISKQEELFLF